MINAMKLLGWAMGTGVVLYALFAPQGGLIEAGPGAWIGLCLLGAGAMRHVQQMQAIGEETETR